MVNEALELKTGVKSAMGDGGFQLVKWKSNAHQLMEGDPNVAIPIADKQDHDDKPTKVFESRGFRLKTPLSSSATTNSKQ